ncbi:hypothetical protein [Clostridium sp. JN-9]|uniref:hypothetical protein n=1 Tax=Clostridium sp. JN-9 TaxID=2507159 RepID=UPI000FFE2732|nr:hypothetical protein [Clostridium sp. JN-9]QAT39540.1 hypothetical protein EQM05_04335 [Clostridium sp. JN-9]
MENEKCKDCMYITNMQEKIEKLEQDVTELEVKVNTIETENAVSREKIDSICSSISRIEKSIEKIADKIEQNNQRPVALLYSAAGGIIIALIIAGIKFIK